MTASAPWPWWSSLRKPSLPWPQARPPTKGSWSRPPPTARASSPALCLERHFEERFPARAGEREARGAGEVDAEVAGPGGGAVGVGPVAGGAMEGGGRRELGGGEGFVDADRAVLAEDGGADDGDVGAGVFGAGDKLGVAPAFEGEEDGRVDSFADEGEQARPRFEGVEVEVGPAPSPALAAFRGWDDDRSLGPVDADGDVAA